MQIPRTNIESPNARHPSSPVSRRSSRIPEPAYVTFISPLGIKGVYVFAAIAHEMARRRPDIPFLVAQGRSHADALMNPPLGLAPRLLGQFPIAPVSDGRNITTMPFTPDPRDFYPPVLRTKLLLMPSLWLESFGLVAAEAMFNGVPVLASNRGALPETIGDAGFLFDIPDRYTFQTRELPTADDVAPWIETILRLWDDPVEYDRCSRAARQRAQAWHPDRLAPLYRDFFAGVADQSRSASRITPGSHVRFGEKSNVQASGNRVTFDGAYHFRYDAQGNRTSKYRSESGELDHTAREITLYRYDDNRMTGLARYRDYQAYRSADPDEALGCAIGPLAEQAVRGSGALESRL